MIIEYEIIQNRPVIHIFSRDKNGNRIYEKVSDFKPYFYVLESEKVPDDKRIINIEEGNFVSLFNEKLKKIYTDIPGSVRELRKKFSKTYEADILFCNRFLIDRVEKLNPHPWHIVFFDIEITSEGRMPSVQNPDMPIINICCYSNFTKKYVSFIWHEKISEIKYYNKSSDWEIREFPNEFSMLRDFINYLKDLDFDILTGWNIQNFDLPYLKSRCDFLGVDFKILSPLYSISENENEIKIRGRVIFDLIKGYRFISERRRSYALSYIARKENLKTQKGMVERNNLKSLWDNDIDKLLIYNKTDVEILVELNEKLKIIDFFDTRRLISHSLWEDVLMNSKVIDNLILKFCNNKIILPSKLQKRKIQSEKYVGAIVIPPKPGLHENVGNLDISAMYPSIIKSINISPETISDDGEIVLDSEHKFKKEIGLLPRVFDNLFKLRKFYQSKMNEFPVGSDEYNIYDKLQFSVKGLINSIYGVMGYSGSRYFNKKTAESVTLVGRKIIEFCMKKVKEFGFDVIYGDTDGIYITKPGANLNDYEKLVDILNNSFTDFFKEYGIEKFEMNIKFEKFYSKIFFYEAKKRYAGHLIYNKGKSCDEIDIVGLEVRRSDNSDFGEFVQQKVLEMILRGDKKENIINFVRDCIRKINSHEVSIYEIGLPKLIVNDFNDYKANTPWVRGARYSNKYLSTNFGRGSKIKLLWLKSTGKYPNSDVVCFDDEMKLPSDFIYDEQKMAEANVIQKVTRIFAGLGWDLNDIFITCKLSQFL